MGFTLNQYKAEGISTFKGKGAYRTLGRNEILPKGLISVSPQVFKPRVRSAGQLVNITLNVGTKNKEKVESGENDFLDPLVQAVKNAYSSIPNTDVKAFGFGVSSTQSGQPVGDVEGNGGANGRDTNTARSVNDICDGKDLDIKIYGGTREEVRERMKISDIVINIAMESYARKDENGDYYDASVIIVVDRTDDGISPSDKMWAMRTRGVEMHEPALLEAIERNKARKGKFDGGEPDNTHGNVGVEWELWTSDNNWQPELSEEKLDRFDPPKEVYRMLVSKLKQLKLYVIFNRFL